MIIKRIVRKLRSYTRSELEQRIRNGLLPGEVRNMDDTDEQDVFVAGYPKSGNTWCQCCIAAIQYGLDIRKTPDELVQTLTPDVYLAPKYLRIGTPTCFKTHWLPQPHYRRVIWLLRDGRDAMTSYFHYLNALGQVSDDDLEAVVLDGKGTLFKWKDHTLAWHENPYNAELMVLKYEEMLASPKTAIRKIADFIGVDLCKDQIDAIADATSFQSMKQREATIGWAKKRRWPTSKPFVRRGVAGGYRDELSSDILNRFEADAREALEIAGYSVDNFANLTHDMADTGS